MPFLRLCGASATHRRVLSHRHPAADDLRTMVAGLRLTRRVALMLPGAEVESDGDLARFVREHAETLYHPVGTCRMGAVAPCLHARVSATQSRVTRHASPGGIMAEALVQFDTIVATADGRRFVPSAWGRDTGTTWEGWIEFFPVEMGESLCTARETVQPNRDDLMYWAQGLSQVFLEGALVRAIGSPASDDPRPDVSGPA